MKNIRKAAGLVFLLLAGCDSSLPIIPTIFPSGPSEYAPALSQEKGAIIVSVTRTRPDHGRGGGISDATVFFGPQGADERRGLSWVTQGSQSGTFDGGKVFIVELPVGSYEFNDWTVVQGAYNRYSPKKPMSIPFNVEPGVVKYLGEINVDLLIPDGGPLGMPGISGIRVSVKDSQVRDLAVLAKKFPKMPPSGIKLDVMRTPVLEY
jgi:hypothetical protein